MDVSPRHTNGKHRRAALRTYGAPLTLPTLWSTSVTMHAMTGQNALDHETWLEMVGEIARNRELNVQVISRVWHSREVALDGVVDAFPATSIMVANRGIISSEKKFGKRRQIWEWRRRKETEL
jgi:hypothetical protein